MFEIDPNNKYHIEMAMKKRSSDFYCYLKVEVYFDNDGTMYKRFVVVLQNKKDSDFVPFSILVDAIDHFNSIV